MLDGFYTSFSFSPFLICDIIAFCITYLKYSTRGKRRNMFKRGNVPICYRLTTIAHEKVIVSIEGWMGKYFCERDIVYLEDDFGRNTFDA